MGLSLSSMLPLCLTLTQIQPGMNPFWYYFFGSATGLCSWSTVCLSSLSDAMPAKWRAPCFGLLFSSLSLGFCIAPFLAMLLGHLGVSILSLVGAWGGILMIIFFFPETVTEETREYARRTREEKSRGLSGIRLVGWNLYRPIWELSILNRSNLFRLLSTLAFFSSIVSTGDRTLLIYYIEEWVCIDTPGRYIID